MLCLRVYSPMTAWWQEEGQAGSTQTPTGGSGRNARDGPWTDGCTWLRAGRWGDSLPCVSVSLPLFLSKIVRCVSIAPILYECRRGSESTYTV